MSCVVCLYAFGARCSEEMRRVQISEQMNEIRRNAQGGSRRREPTFPRRRSAVGGENVLRITDRPSQARGARLSPCRSLRAVRRPRSRSRRSSWRTASRRCATTPFLEITLPPRACPSLDRRAFADHARPPRLSSASTNVGLTALVSRTRLLPPSRERPPEVPPDHPGAPQGSASPGERADDRVRAGVPRVQRRGGGVRVLLRARRADHDVPGAKRLEQHERVRRAHDRLHQLHQRG